MAWTVYWSGFGSPPGGEPGFAQGVAYLEQGGEPTYQDCRREIPGFVRGEVFGPNKIHYFLVDNPDRVR